MLDHDDRTGLPASIEAAWGRRGRPAKGPKPGLSLERIVEAAVKIAGADGLAAVSMGRVAAELGTSAMTLYRYLGAKDELLALMVDAAVGTPQPPPTPDEGWRAGLARFAWTYRAALYRHPWSLRIPISGPPVTPNQIAWLEDGLRSMRDTGLTEAEKVSAILLLSGFVRNEATLITEVSAAQASGSASREVVSGYGRLLARLTDAARFPALHAALAAGVFAADRTADDEDADAEFVFGLERILDGLDALVRTRASSTPPTLSA